MSQRQFKLKARVIDRFILVDKPCSIKTRDRDLRHPGLLEILQADRGEALHPLYELDAAISGALAFATSPSESRNLLEKVDMKKTYLFLTHTDLKEAEFVHQSFIAQKGSLFVSDQNADTKNSATFFQFQRQVGPYFLWQATPEGDEKTNQVQLHAADCGIPILGATQNGGQDFYRLCLHCSTVSLEEKGRASTITHTSALPFWTQDFSEDELKLFECLFKRSSLLQVPEGLDECSRLVHQELEDFRIDLFGHFFWVYWYQKSPPEPDDLRKFQRLSQFLKRSGWIREMVNRGAKIETARHGSNTLAKPPSPSGVRPISQLWPIGEPASEWTAAENGIRYEFRSDKGMSPGLFLDQRENRLWVRKNSENKKVLNLFCYTGGFSVNAALGGASETCSVDVSKTYLDWAKTNMSLNQIDVTTKSHQFWEADCHFFLKSCFRKGRKFDLIICDPPSLGRSKEGTFQIQKDLPELLSLCLRCLQPTGQILLSTNYEGWTADDLKMQILSYRNLDPFKILSAPAAGFDFELPGETPLMKSLILEKA